MAYYISRQEEAIAYAKAALAAALQQAEAGLSYNAPVDLALLTNLNATYEKARGLSSDAVCGYCQETFDASTTPHVILEIAAITHSDGTSIQSYGDTSRMAVCEDCFSNKAKEAGDEQKA